jgi:hypothetical protein
VAAAPASGQGGDVPGHQRRIEREGSVAVVEDGDPQVIDDLPRFATVVGHDDPVPFFLTADMFGGLDFEVAGGDISNLVGRPVAGLHAHDVPEIYLLVAASPGEAVIEVEIDGSVREVVAPAAVYVPAGALHRFVTRRAGPGSFCFGVLLTGAAGRGGR